MTVDNCSTNDAVINIILDKLQRSTLVMRGSMLHIRCAADVLNMIVQDGLNVIGSCIEKVRESGILDWINKKKATVYRYGSTITC